MMNGPSSIWLMGGRSCRVSIVVTSGRGGPRWPWLVLGLQLSLLASGCRAGQRDGVVGEIQRRRTTPPCLGRRRGVAAARRLAQVSGQLSQGETAGGFEGELAVLGWRFWGAREAWGTGGRALRGFWVFVPPGGRGGRGGPGDFFTVLICRRGVGAFRVGGFRWGAGRARGFPTRVLHSHNALVEASLLRSPPRSRRGADD